MSIKMVAVAITLLTLANGVKAQQISSSVAVKNIQVSNHNGQVVTRFSIEANQNALRSGRQLTVFPVLNGNGHSQRLTPVIVLGRQAGVYYSRGLYNIQQEDGAKVLSKPIVLGRHGGSSIYSDTLAYEPWMESSSLSLEYTESTCCKLIAERSETVAEGLLKSKQQHVTERPVKTPHAKSQNADAIALEEYHFEVNFPINEATLNKGFMRNNSRLDSLVETISRLSQSGLIAGYSITYIGRTSPDGPVEFNQKLSEARAGALKSYVDSHCTLPGSIQQVKAIGPDWKGLLMMVKCSDTPYKDEVVRIVEHKPVWDVRHKTGRLTALKQLKGGEPYRYMASHIFPKLRSTGCISIISKNRE